MTGLEMAHELLADAEVCLTNQRYRSAVSRSYYAVYHVAIALFEHYGYSYSHFRGRGGRPARRWEHKLITVDFPIQFTQSRSVLAWGVVIRMRELYDARLTAD